jgi:hypothetical protein
MIQKDTKKLDNPVWYSLAESHKQYAITYDETPFYDPEYCPFGAALDPKQSANALAQYSQLSANFFIVGEKPEIPPTLQLENELVCLQMMIKAPINAYNQYDHTARRNSQRRSSGISQNSISRIF